MLGSLDSNDYFEKVGLNCDVMRFPNVAGIVLFNHIVPDKSLRAAFMNYKHLKLSSLVPCF